MEPRRRFGGRDPHCSGRGVWSSIPTAYPVHRAAGPQPRSDTDQPAFQHRGDSRRPASFPGEGALVQRADGATAARHLARCRHRCRGPGTSDPRADRVSTACGRISPTAGRLAVCSTEAGCDDAVTPTAAVCSCCHRGSSRRRRDRRDLRYRRRIAAQPDPGGPRATGCGCGARHTGVHVSYLGHRCAHLSCHGGRRHGLPSGAQLDSRPYRRDWRSHRRIPRRTTLGGYYRPARRSIQWTARRRTVRHPADRRVPPG